MRFRGKSVWPIMAMILMSIGQAQAKSHRVASVYDGDTIMLADKWGPYGLSFSVRLLAKEGGIDTPERSPRSRCEAEARGAITALRFVVNMIAASGNVIWIKNQPRHDKYGGRILATVYVKIDGKTVSLGDELIRAGLAVPYNGIGPREDWCAGAPLSILPE